MRGPSKLRRVVSASDLAPSDAPGGRVKWDAGTSHAWTLLVLRRRWPLLLLGIACTLTLTMCCVMLRELSWKLGHVGHAPSAHPLQTELQPVPAAMIQASAVAATAGPGGAWDTARRRLVGSAQKYVIVDARNGLGNRLRALGSAMAVAAFLHRPLILVWVPDLHCNCSYTSLFASPHRFAILEEEVPLHDRANASLFQYVNYMPTEEGGDKDAKVESVDYRRHLYFRSGFLMNHYMGGWTHVQRYLQRLTPAPRVEALLVTDRSMIGLHVRNVFDAPRDRATAQDHVGSSAIAQADKE
jgi:hypothetical protein